MRVRLARGEIDLPARYVDAGHVGHAYAMTVNKAHGLTCDRTMTLGDDQIYRELAYEALTRGRLSNQIYIPRPACSTPKTSPHARTLDAPDPMETLEQGLRRRHAKHLALDAMATFPLQIWTTGIFSPSATASGPSSPRHRRIEAGPRRSPHLVATARDQVASPTSRSLASVAASVRSESVAVLTSS